MTSEKPDDGELVKSLERLYNNCINRKDCAGCVFWRKYQIADAEDTTCIMSDKLNEAMQ